MDIELVRRGLADSRVRAQEDIREGRVLVNGSIATKPDRLVAAFEAIEHAAAKPRYVSRGGEKLEGALAEFSIHVTGLRCLDLGASTGGFTDCLLQHGAASVVAIDVGHGQMAWQLRKDERVTVMERTDVREMDPNTLGPFGLVTADLSFISLRTVMPAIATLARSAPVIALVKPQFEVGRGRVGRGGVVRDPALHSEAVTAVIEAAGEAGLHGIAAVPSPIEGAEGNKEFFVLLKAKP